MIGNTKFLFFLSNFLLLFTGGTGAYLDFAMAIQCATSRNPVAFMKYGCFCGFGGSGEPVDEIDRCCKTHDKCYQKLEDNRICVATESNLSYSFECYNGTPHCSKNENDLCKESLCECDSEAALCFSRHRYPKQKPKCPTS